MADAFRSLVLQNKESSQLPVVTLGSCSFLHMRELISLFKSYFNVFDEDSLRNNFVIIYELLDEVMDNGYPQIVQAETLKLYITQQGVKAELDREALARRTEESRNATMQVTGAVGWRRQGLQYKTNEVYLDIIETVNLLMSSRGDVLRSDVTGRIVLKCLLSGMPELKLGLNDKLGMDKDGGGGGHLSGEGGAAARPGAKSIDLDDVTFHQCVNLSRFSTEKTVSFVPPDGEFELMKYRVTDGVILPFKVMPVIREMGRSRVEITVKVKTSGFSQNLFANNVVVKVPVPKHTAKATTSVSAGKAKYKSEHNAIVWKVKRFPGQSEITLSADVELASTLQEKKPWARPPISLSFQVPMFTSSGLRVRFLKVWEKSGYNTVKWVRYVTRAGEDAGVRDAGSYEVRLTE